jgi:hypothetical protein
MMPLFVQHSILLIRERFPQPVLLAMIGGTIADVLGIFYIVTHYLFSQPEVSKTSQKALAKKAMENV